MGFHNLYTSKALSPLERLVRVLLLRLAEAKPNEVRSDAGCFNCITMVLTTGDVCWAAQFPPEDAVDADGILPHRTASLLQQAWLGICDGNSIGVLEGLKTVSSAALSIREERLKALKDMQASLDQQVCVRACAVYGCFIPLLNVSCRSKVSAVLQCCVTPCILAS